jgi:RHS repeat-associated protein/uncharacterized repeat protein (TIGR01451 family)
MSARRFVGSACLEVGFRRRLRLWTISALTVVAAVVPSTMAPTLAASTPESAANLPIAIHGPDAPISSAATQLPPPVAPTLSASGSQAAAAVLQQRATDGSDSFGHWHGDSSGKVTRTLSPAPVNRPSGSTWVPVDTSVASSPAGSGWAYTAANALVPVHFGATARPDTLVGLDLPGGSVTLTASLLHLAAPERVGNDIVFHDVAPDTDIRYTLTPQGLKEDIELRSPNAPRSFTFHLADPGNTLGTLEGKDDGPRTFSTLINGDVRVGLAPEYAYSQAAALAGHAPHLPGSAHSHMVRAGDGYDITVSLDNTWIQNKPFPIVLDPTITFFQGNGSMVAGFDIYGNSQYDPCNGGHCVPNTNADLGAGSFTGGGYDEEPFRSFFHFDLAKYLPANSQINSAQLLVYTSACLDDGTPATYYCNQHSYTVEAHNLTGGWDSQHGWAYTTWDTLNADTDPASLYTIVQPPFNICSGTGCISPFYMTFDITGEAQAWINGTRANNGVVLMLQSPTPYNIGGPYWNYLGPAGNSGGNLPQLQVTYTPPPEIPNNVTTSAGDGTATVSWSPPYNNGGPAPSSYTTSMYNSSGSLIGTQTCSGCTSATFGGVNGQTYSFSVYATNSVGNGPTAYTTLYKAVDHPYLAKGEVASYTVMVNNPTSGTLRVMSTTDTLPPGMAFNGPLSTVLRLINGIVQQNSTCTYCTVSGNQLSIGGFTLLPGENESFTYHVVALPVTDRDCTTSTNTASSTNVLGTSTSSAPVSICDTGLGNEAWWSYVSRSAGPQATARVNVANGNLVLQQTDSTPIQAHGRLAYVIRRTYNSQDATLLSLPGSIGAGWVFNVDQADDLVGDGVGATSLYVPPVESILNPGSVTLIDRDGTRHVFLPRGISNILNVLSATGAAVTGDLTELVPRVLAIDASKYTNICVDETYQAPAGVHLSLWRYFEVNSLQTSGPCVSAAGSTPVLLGFAAERPDRVRYEFAADGHMLDMQDGAGNDLRYVYQNLPAAGLALGNLTAVYEPRSCPAATNLLVPSTCRAIRFSYSANEVDVADPAGRTTKYQLDGNATTPHLVRVVNPDGSVLNYSYGNCGGTAQQLCSASDPRGNTTGISYAAAPSPSLPRVATLTDRRGATTSFTYYSSPDYVTADENGSRQRFLNIDGHGRVAEVDEGTTGDTYLHQAFTTWDGNPDPVAGGAAVTCRQPDNAVDNNVCKQTRKSLAATPDETVTYLYNPEGRVLAQHQAVAGGTIDSTWGYHTQYVEVNGTVVCYDDLVQGSGNVSQALSTAPGCASSGARNDANTAYVVSDQTQYLRPAGNSPALGTNFTPYLTTTLVDNAAALSPNSAPSGTVCSTPGVPTSNTGLACEVDAPSSVANQKAITRYTYDTFGQKSTMTTPKAIAETASGQTPLSYTYTYYSDPAAPTQPGNGDISGTTPAGGWLKAVTDPTGAFVAFGYDAAGNVTRTWDRNATQGLQPSAFPGTVAAAPSSAYAETVHWPATPSSTGYASPWRSIASMRDQVGDVTSFTPDANGNPTSITSARGNITTEGFDPGDGLICTVAPVEANGQQCASYRSGQARPAEPAHATQNWFDSFGNKVETMDPNGVVSVMQYDSVNRLTTSLWTRGPWPSDTTQVPPACRQSTSGDAPIPAGRILCSTIIAYDGVDNVTSSQDGNHHTATTTYDAVHRPLTKVAPRNDGTLATLTTGFVYDLDGHAVETCRPRNTSEGGATSCQLGALYGTQLVYDVAGRVQSQTTHRSSTEADVVSTAYDADGNMVSRTDQDNHTTTWVYDLLDRKTTQSVPHDSTTTYVTAWTYDPSGFETSVTLPGARTTAYGYDAAHRLTDTVQGASNPNATLAGTPDTTGGTNVRTRVTYDVAGDVIARYDPRAFATSTATPDASYMIRIDYDADNRPIAQYVPRYDGVLNTNLDTTGTQASQCPTGATGYPTGVGTCVSRMAYDAAGNRSRLTLPTSNGADNRYVTFSYTDDNLLATVNSPAPDSQNESRVTSATSYYDANGKPVKVVDALGHQQTTSYFDDGTVNTETAQPNGSVTHVVTHTRDANGNETRTVDGSGNASTAIYSMDNLVVDRVDGAGNDTHYAYDPAGNVLQIFSPSAVAKDSTNPSGTPTTNAYNVDNTLNTTSVPVSGDGSVLRVTSYGYDSGGRKSSQNTKQGATDGGTQSFTWLSDDRLASETGRGTSGETITMKYDPAGHPTSIVDSTGSLPSSAASTLSATYYLDGSLRSVDDGQVTTQDAYDALGSRVFRSDVNDLTKDSHQTAYPTTYAYNDAELPASMSSASAGAGSTSWLYDAVGRQVQETDANGQRIARVYNADDTLASQSLSPSSGSPMATWSYSYNGDYLQTSQTYSGAGVGAAAGQMSFGYDGANRLTTLTLGSSTQTISWDHNGNRLGYKDLTSGATTTFTYHADNTIANSGFAYDANGRLTSDGCFTYAYDGFDRQAGAAAGSSSCPTSTASTTYAYDGLGRQRSHTEGLTTTTLHEDGLGAQVTMETAAAVDTVYGLTPNGSPTAVSREAAPVTTQFLVDDGFGNVSTATTATQTVACAARFDPFGTPLGAQSSSNPCNSGSTIADAFYRGARRDATTGQYLFGSRTYDPSKASFLTPDSYQTAPPEANNALSADPLTANTYSYVNGDPVNLSDPNGHEPVGSLYDWGNPYYYGQRNAAGHPVSQAQRAQAEAAYRRSSRAQANERTFVNLICVHHQTSNVPCDSVLSDTPSTSNVCYSTFLDSGYCYTLGSVYGTADSPATPDSTRIRAIADALVQESLANPILRHPSKDQMASVAFNLLSFAAGGVLAKLGAKALGLLVDVLRGARAAEDVAGAASEAPILGNKVRYLLGAATGDIHNIERSQSMASELSRIGIGDTPMGASYLEDQLTAAYSDTTNVVGDVSTGGRTVKESLLMGPGGALKMRSVWDGQRLITVILMRAN